VGAQDFNPQIFSKLEKLAPNPNSLGIVDAKKKMETQFKERSDCHMAMIRYQPRELGRREWTEWDPFAQLRRLQEEMMQLFDTSIARAPLTQAMIPACDVFEDKDNIIVKTDLPGLTREEIDISIQDNVLTFRGEKKHEEQIKEENCYRLERMYGSFSRSIELPTTVDANKVSAIFKNGVLSITLPKTEEAKPKQIKVKVE
jgi:HSP20 family protein